MELRLVGISKPDEVNLILGQSHFIKTVEDLYEALVQAVPGIRFGLAFCESSGPCLVRADGTDPELKEAAVRNAGGALRGSREGRAAALRPEDDPPRTGGSRALTRGDARTAPRTDPWPRRSR